MISKSSLSALAIIVFACSAALSAQTVDPPKETVSAATPVNESYAANREDINARYKIGYHDTLDIRIDRHPDLAQRVSVTADGTIALFRLKEPIVAACRTERELADIIATAYKKDYLRNPQVSVVATEQRSQMVSVIGAVEKPGSFFLTRRVRLLELIALAGGPSKEAGSRVLIARSGSTSNCEADNAASDDDDDSQLIDLKVNEILTAKQNIVIQPGDTVFFSEADVVYLYGNVNEQGKVVMKEPITLTQAIASAKGLKPSTKKDRVRILRQKSGSMDREEFVYDLNDIDKQKVQDPFLQPNDIVAVSEDKVKSILNAIKTSVTQGIPSIVARPY